MKSIRHTWLAVPLIALALAGCNRNTASDAQQPSTTPSTTPATTPSTMPGSMTTTPSDMSASMPASAASQ